MLFICAMIIALNEGISSYAQFKEELRKKLTAMFLLLLTLLCVIYVGLIINKLRQLGMESPL